MPEGEMKIAPVVIGLGLGLAAVVVIYALAQAAPSPEGYACPYCDATFDTYAELVEHVQQAHPGKRIPIHIVWE